MSQTNPTPNQKMVTELKVSAHLMLLDPGLFCVFHSPGAPPPDPATGLPGVRITRPPATAAESLSISTFNPDGWLGGEGNAALVRVGDVPSQVLVTIYQAVNSTVEAPKLQVLRLSEGAPARPAQAPVPVAAPAPEAAPVAAPPEAAEKPEVAAHVQRRGDVLTRLGDWMGTRGSQNWIEGFAIAPSRFVEPTDIEYQAVLGKGWLSPWAEGGTYCGSRGMALPILGLRVRLKGEAAERYETRLSATFTDGATAGPVGGAETAEAPSLAPLEAFLVEIVPVNQAGAVETAADQAGPEPQAVVAREPAARGKTSRSAARAEPTRPEPTRVEPARPATRAEPSRPAARAESPRPAAKAPEKPLPTPQRGGKSARSSQSSPVAKAGSKARR